MRILIAILLTAPFSLVWAESKCPHEHGIYCPVVEAPRVTELRAGTVLLQYLVLTDGSVENIEVIESTGDPRWVNAVINTVQTWKYDEPTKQYKQNFKFNAVLAP
jgi:TonB family protein